MIRVGWAACVRGLVVLAGMVVLALSCGHSRRTNRAGAGGGEPNAENAEGGRPAYSDAGEGALDRAGQTGTGATPQAVELGRACREDRDCEIPGLVCLGPEQDYDTGAGAPPGGLCTAACRQDSDCAPFDETAVCATLAEQPLDRLFAEAPVPRFCMLGCSLGSPGGRKCQGRSDLACRPFAPDGAVQCDENGGCPHGSFCYRDRCRELACGPRCNGDDDCSGDRFCDPSTGLCSTDRPEPVAIGRDCNVDLPGLDDCGYGTCLALFDEGVRLKGLCTQSCTLGHPCGNKMGACVLPRFSDYAVGDIAYCAATCNSGADCENPADACRPFDDEGLEAQYGSLGICDYAPAAMGGGAGGAGGAAGASGESGSSAGR